MGEQVTDAPAVKLSAGDLLSASIRMTREHIWFLLIISVLLATLYVAGVIPFLGTYIQFFGGIGGVGQPDGAPDFNALNEQLLETIKWAWIFTPITMLAMMAVVVLWIRRLALGPSHMFDGGFLVFLWRSVLCIWRYICAIVLSMAVMLAAMIPVALLFGLIALLRDGGVLAAVAGLVVMMLTLLVYIVAGVGFVLVMVALVISLTATSLDYRLGIIKCARLLKGNWVSVTLAVVALGLALTIVSLLLFAVVLGWGVAGGVSEDGVSTGLIVFVLLVYAIGVAMYGPFGALGVAAFEKLRPDAPNAEAPPA